jgi:transglutaminase-like putative cysteine protease
MARWNAPRRGDLDDDLDDVGGGVPSADHRPRRAIGTYTAVAVAIVAVMSVIAAVAFRSTLSGWSFVSAAAIGAVGASVIVLFARFRRLLLGESVALSAVGFVVLGGVAAGGVPTPGAYGAFARGLVDGWADLLSSAPPADITEQFRALPFTVAWLSAAVGGEIARHSRRPGLPAIGPILALALSLLFTVEERWLALAQGAGILAGTLMLITAGQRFARRRFVATLDEFDAGAVATNRTRLMLGAVVVVGAVVVAPVVGPHLPGAESNERFDLRRYQVPPFDPLQVPSPLAEVKASLKDDRKDDVVFTVSGDTAVTRLPVAVMTDYDGVIWTVADPKRDEAGTEFVPVDTQLPALDDPVPEGSTTVTNTITITDLGGHFLPTAGIARQLDLPSAGGNDSRDLDPRMNLGTGTIALPGGVPDGLTYEIRSAIPPQVSEDQLRDAKIRSVDYSKELELLPKPVLNLAADLVQGRDAGWERMTAIRDEFVNSGFYDATPDTPPGHSYGRIAAMLTDPSRIIGFEEQYAAAAALMAEVAGLPVRVVVGYEIPPDAWKNGSADVTANDISAWVELDSGNLGWVPVDVTPDRSRTPDPDARGATTQQVAIPNPPPPPPPPPEVQPPRQEERKPDDKNIDPITFTWDDGAGWAAWAVVAAGVAAVPILLLLAFVAVVVGWKALRRWRRRTRPSTTGRIAGAWAEAIDRCTEAGAPRLTEVTPQERVGVYVHTPVLDEVEGDLRRLAGQVDRATYAATAPDAEHAADAWRCSDGVTAELRRRHRLVQRVRMHLDPRPLRRDHATHGARPSR